MSSHALLALPLVLIAAITVVDLNVPADVHLGPLLVIAPAITASFAGPRLTALIGLLAVGAQAFIGWYFDVLSSRNVLVQILALAVLSCLAVVFCVARERRQAELAQVRTVAEAAQRVLMCARVPTHGSHWFVLQRTLFVAAASAWAMAYQRRCTGRETALCGW
ncbi:hypothetical protein ACIRRH_24410 [Kitasatospora sp. NPDC101235]|uniref:hypothetical protein n=1 Tax=Kitasatospora sp. NPDC101235 TaxID=3364101 RepID=UPI00382082A9